LAIGWLKSTSRRLPLRWRLTIWYVILLAVLLVVFSGSVLIGIRFLLNRSIDNTLENQAALLTESIEIENGQPSIGGDRRIRNRPGQQFVRLVDQDGELLTDSSSILADVSNDDPGLDRALNGQLDLRWRTILDERMRVLSQPVEVEDEVVAVVQVGLTGRGVETIFSQTLTLVLSAGAVVLILSVIGGVLLADRALKPIDQMTRLAALIGERDLSQRIEPPLSDDELGRLARTFNDMLDRLEGGMNRQRQFTAAASHELRTPLAMMQSQIELALAQDRSSEDDDQVFESLRSDVNRLARISSTLLALARSDAGEMKLDIEVVELHALLDLIAEQYRPLAESSGIDLRVSSREVRIRGDEDRLIQLLVNLVDNALQHTDSGNAVSLECAIDPPIASLIVADQGRGIEPKHLPYVFERFYRADSSRERSGNGAGLGLSISKMIVDAHKGSIDVLSTPGSGTSVIVKLPLDPAR
jgi:heavy metal sensor kinase